MSDYLQAKAAANPGKIYYVEDCTDCGDASYNALLSYMPDGVHPNAKGTHAMGVRMAPLLKAIFAPNDPRIASAADSYFVSPSVPSTSKPHDVRNAGLLGRLHRRIGDVGIRLQGGGRRWRRQPDPVAAHDDQLDWCG